MNRVTWGARVEFLVLGSWFFVLGSSGPLQTANWKLETRGAAAPQPQPQPLLVMNRVVWTARCSWWFLVLGFWFLVLGFKFFVLGALQTATCKLQTRGPWPRLNLNLNLNLS